MTAHADSPLIEPVELCADCNRSATTTAYAGHIRTPDGFERVDLPACEQHARERDEERVMSQRDWWA